MSEEERTKGERTHQAILDAAYDLIIEQGYAATSVRQIAERAGLALGSIYNHFASKEEIFHAIVRERHPFFQIVPILNSVQGESAEEFVRKAAHTLVDQLGHHPDFLNLMLTEMVEFKGSHVASLFGTFFPMLLPLSERLRGLDGNIRPIPPFVLVRAFLGMFFSYYITETLMANALPPERRVNALDYFVDIFLQGILVRETA